jgi:hypothetical protein
LDAGKRDFIDEIAQAQFYKVRQKIPTFETGNTSRATSFPPNIFSVFCKITRFFYGPGLMGNPVQACIPITYVSINNVNVQLC